MDRGGETLTKAATANAKETSSHMPSETINRFRRGDTVQDVPTPNGRNNLGQGTVKYTELLAGEEQVTVEFHESGEVRTLPSHRLRKVSDVNQRFVNRTTSGPDDCERLRLRCLAHALESWNERSGALDRLPVDPLPHQIDIVHRIMTADQTNWLIADDVGLGKTIEVGLLLAAMKRRRRLNRVLVVCPAALTTQWQDEMKKHFNEDYRIYGHDFNINQTSQWNNEHQVIVSIDRAKLRNHLPKFEEAGDWDIVVFDEAHHLSKRENASTTQRYRLAETLRSKSDEFLFLTGTPHQGDTEQFVNLLSLLRPDLKRRLTKVDADPSVVAEVVLKNKKSSVIDQEGNYVFQGQDTKLVKADKSSEMQEFQEALMQYVDNGYAASESEGDRGRAIGFVMTTYRKLASSSIAAIQASLERRLARLLTENDDWYEHIGTLDEFDEPFNDAEDGRDDLGIVADNIAAREMGATQFFSNETSQLQRLITAAKAARSVDLKLQYFLRNIVDAVVQNAEKLLIYTEYLATQDYIVEALRNRYPSLNIAKINGGMKLEDKLTNIRNFNEDASFMVSTEAGGEGINLHRECHIMVNYDIPWNPRRLVQRAGRLYRYGQTEQVIVRNLVVEDSFDNRSLSMMLERVENIADQMFNVEGNTTELLRTEIVGELMERLDYAKMLTRNTDRNMRRSEEELERALELAQSATEQQDFLFSQVENFNRLAGEPVKDLSQDDVMSLLEGMLAVKQIHIRRRLYGGTVLEIELPDDLIGHYGEFAHRRVVRVTHDRDRSTALNNVVQMDFESPFFRSLIDEAKSSEFGGEYAQIRGTQDSAFALFKLRWNNDQGQPRWEALLPVLMPLSASDGATSTDQTFAEILRRLTPVPLNDESNDLKARQELLDLMRAEAEHELSARRSELRYPGGIVLLAAADIIADK